VRVNHSVLSVYGMFRSVSVQFRSFSVIEQTVLLETFISLDAFRSECSLYDLVAVLVVISCSGKG